MSKIDFCIPENLDDKSIEIVIDLLNEKYETYSKQAIDSNLKKEVEKVLNENKLFKSNNFSLLNLFSNSKKEETEMSEFINKDKFVELICILLPKQEQIGGDEVTTYEKPKYFSYDKRYFKYDVFAIGALIISLLLLYISYAQFSKFVGDVGKVVDYNSLVTNKNLQIDSSSASSFFKYAYELIKNTLCSTKDNIFTYIKNEIISLEFKTLQEVDTKCYINVENTYVNTILKGIQMFYNPTGSQNCALEIINHNLLMEMHNKIHNLKLTQIQVNDIFIYSYRAIQLGFPAVSYLSVRMGIRALSVNNIESYPQPSSSSQSAPLTIQNQGGKVNKTKKMKLKEKKTKSKKAKKTKQNKITLKSKV